MGLNITRAEAKTYIKEIEKALKEGFCPPKVIPPAGECGALRTAAVRLGLNRNVGSIRLERIKILYDMEPNYDLWKPKTKEQIARYNTYNGIKPTTTRKAEYKKVEKLELTEDLLVQTLKKEALSVDELVVRFATTKASASKLIKQAIDHGKNLHCYGDKQTGKWTVERTIAPQHASGTVHQYKSRKDNTYKFGFTSDNHLGSKYERLDVLNDLYDWFQLNKVDRVFNAGNWIEGEARFNKFDIHVYGMDNQVEYLVANYPQRDGIKTYAISGDDHEGWYAQREGVNIGKYAQHRMRDAGREDWIDLGYQEAYVSLVNANTGTIAQLLNTHPGGGSAYATSYKSQKAVEAFDGGEKPSVLLQGHYHKLLFMMTRNVWVIQTGCTKDQDSFLRKNMISAHVGGGIAELVQDPITGAIISCKVEFKHYFNKGHYNDRFSHSGKVNLPDRVTK